LFFLSIQVQLVLLGNLVASLLRERLRNVLPLSLQVLHAQIVVNFEERVSYVFMIVEKDWVQDLSEFQAFNHRPRNFENLLKRINCLQVQLTTLNNHFEPFAFIISL